MKELFQELAWKCMQNDVTFTTTTVSGGEVLVDIYKIEDDAHVFTAQGYIAGWEFEEPSQALNRLHNALDDYLEQKELSESITDEEFVTERPKLLTINELRMADAGHRMKDFS